MATEPIDGVHELLCRGEPDAYDRIRAYLTDDGTLVDTGLPDTTETLLAEIEETGIVPERVVITHMHGDHSGGIAAVLDSYDADLALPVGADPEETPSVDRFYGDGDAVGPFEAVHVPGHVGHQHALIATDDDYAILADAVSGSDQRGLAGGFHLPPGKYTQDLGQAEQSLEKLTDYAFDTGLVFHGSNVLSNASAKLDRYVLPAE
ncbi:MBL fold metallo-hydrolase [Halosegnis longus]|uniref:MBL fold metallo-hydrolase n=1 Tax=Halosegnis longus TaxID=2216012 RepID=A0AAJ4UVU1_9EURY|nr:MULTISPECIES: MBL fold metallo-hydrolase [Halobacteriales]RNJ26240.1 MBL fold metallo-hydrolase [Salella cibi]